MKANPLTEEQAKEAARACMRLAADFQRDIDEAMKAADL